MDIVRAKEIICALSEGVDPTTGELLDADNVCNKGEVVRAFYAIIQVLDNKKQKNTPENAGKPWSVEEEQRLEILYARGMSQKAIANELGRTPGSISSRLEKMGLKNG
jgi:DNA-binding NarL/FixJ family response regulator